jgi:endo-beta-N-acetylglucosaminidase D
MVHYTETLGVSSVLNILDRQIFIVLYLLQIVAVTYVWYDSIQRDGDIVWQTAEILADLHQQIKRLEKPFI